MQSIVRALAKSCWLFFKWSVLGAAIGAALAIPRLSERVDDEIRRRVEAHFAQYFDGLKVTIRSAELMPGRGIAIRGLAVLEPGAEGPRAELAQVEEIFVACPTNLEELVAGEPEIGRVVLRRPTVRATRRPDGSWSVAKLLRPRAAHKGIPEVRIESGSVELFDPLRNPSSTFTLREVNLVVGPAEGAPAAPGASRSCKFEGTCTGDLLRQVEVTGTFDAERPHWGVSGVVEGLDVSPELFHVLPEEWGPRLDVGKSLRGQGRLEFRAEYDPDVAGSCRFRCTGHLVRGRVEDTRLPHPLTDVRGTVVCTNDAVVIERLSARSNSASLAVSGRRSGYDAQSALVLEGEVRGLELDQQLADALPEKLREQWHRHLPAGQVDARFKLAYDGQSWQPDLSIQCLNVSFTYDKFPYRVEHGQGTLELRDNTFTASVTAYSGNQPVRVTVETAEALTRPHGWAQAKGENIPLDDKLLTALDPKSRAVVRSLDPKGTVNFVVQAGRDKPGEPLHRYLLVGLNRCSVRYEKFSYPIANIRGTLEMRDGHWSFRDLEGFNDTGRLTGEGTLVPTPEGNRLRLSIVGTGVALDEELRDALKPGMQQVWNNLQPQGMVDVRAEISYLAGRDQFAVDLRAEPRSENSSIKPTYFPYRLDKLRGVLTYRDGHVALEQFRSEHGNTRVASSGQCDFFPDGSWRLELDQLNVERLRLDREFTAALPGRLRKAVAELNPAGPIQVRGLFAVAQDGRPGDPLSTQWDLAVGFQQASVDFGLKLDNLHGEVRLVGACDGDHFQSRGELALDSAMYKDFQVTRVTGPIWIDDERILFGTWVDRPPAGQPAPARSDKPAASRSLFARLFGGTLVADGWVALGPTPRYALHAELSQGDLARCVQEVSPGAQNLRGTIRATVDLHGSGRTLNLLGGHGRVRLSEADVYEVPVMIALLKMLRAQRPDRAAFSTSDIDFRIEGNHIYIDRIKFAGDAISLVGNGEMNFQSELRLTLHAMVGRGERDLPVLQQVLGGASQQIMLVHVGGTLQNPETSREPFPGVARAIQQLQNDRDLGAERRALRKR